MADTCFFTWRQEYMGSGIRPPAIFSFWSDSLASSLCGHMGTGVVKNLFHDKTRQRFIAIQASSPLHMYKNTFSEWNDIMLPFSYHVVFASYIDVIMFCIVFIYFWDNIKDLNGTDILFQSVSLKGVKKIFIKGENPQILHETWVDKCFTH